MLLVFIFIYFYVKQRDYRLYDGAYAMINEHKHFYRMLYRCIMYYV